MDNMTNQRKPWVKTPLLESTALSRAAGWYGPREPAPATPKTLKYLSRVLIKYENLQPSGSFKSRGIGNYLMRRLAERGRGPYDAAPVHFYASSGGNAGLAAVHAAVHLGHPCTVVVPLSTKPMMIAKLRAAGAHDVIQHGATWREADTHLREHVMGPGAVYVPPFDHEDVWQGHAEIMREVAAQLAADYGGARPAAVVCSVGGGGLFNGTMLALEELGWDDVTVLAMETRGADSLNASLVAGEHVTLPGITSQATTLGATRVSAKTWELAQRPQVRSVVLDDAEAAMGCWRLADDERILVELSCGVSVAPCYDGRLEEAMGRKVGADEIVVIVLCGGSTVTFDMLAQWRDEFAAVEKSMPRHKDVPSDITAPGVNRENVTKSA